MTGNPWRGPQSLVIPIEGCHYVLASQREVLRNVTRVLQFAWCFTGACRRGRMVLNYVSPGSIHSRLIKQVQPVSSGVSWGILTFGQFQGCSFSEHGSHTFNLATFPALKRVYLPEVAMVAAQTQAVSQGDHHMTCLSQLDAA